MRIASYIQPSGGTRFFQRFGGTDDIPTVFNTTFDQEAGVIFKIEDTPSRALSTVMYDHRVQYAIGVSYRDGGGIVAGFLLINELFAVGFQPVILPDTEQF